MPDNPDVFEDGGSAAPVAGDEAASTDVASTDSGDGSANKTTAGHKKRWADALALAVLALLAAALPYLLVVRLPSLIRSADKPTPASADAAATRRQSQQAADAEPEEAPAPLKPEGGTGSKAEARRAAQMAEIADSSGDSDKQKGGTLTGKRSRASIQRVVIQNAARMRYAYNQRLREKPGIADKITVKFAIDEFGSVIFAQSVESTMNDSEFEGVIVGMVKDWKFETADNPGDITEVTYPFVFSQ